MCTSLTIDYKCSYVHIGSLYRAYVTIDQITRNWTSAGIPVVYVVMGFLKLSPFKEI